MPGNRGSCVYVGGFACCLLAPKKLASPGCCCPHGVCESGLRSYIFFLFTL